MAVQLEQPDPREEVAALIARAEVVSPPTAPDVSAGGDTEAGGLDRQLALVPMTDLGNAERFIARFGDRFLWCAALGWLSWDGRRWSADGAEAQLEQAVHDTVREIQSEGAAVRGSNDDIVVGRKGGEPVMWSDKLSRHGRASENEARMRAIPKVARTKLTVEAAVFDADPMAINVLNGTLRIASAAEGDYVTLTPHDPADRLTRLAPVVYDPDAACVAFDRFLTEVQPDASTRRFLLQWLGLSLTGDIGQQKLVVMWGKGRNGKSTLMDAVATIAGDYADTIPVESFVSEGRGRNAGAATPDLARLPGVRMLMTSEPERGARLAEALIKAVTGGEEILARHLNRDYFRFRPQFKLTIAGNYRPEIRGADEGIWRRVCLVPWTVTVPEASVDRQLGDKLRAEASGILNRLLDGVRDWVDNGLVVPAEVGDATGDYREDSDPLGRFLRACVVEEPGERVQASVMHTTFIAWSRSTGGPQWSPRGFVKAMREAGYSQTKVGAMWWLDVRLVAAPGDFAATGPTDGEAEPSPPDVAD